MGDAVPVEILEKHKEKAIELGLNEEQYQALKAFVGNLWSANMELNLFSRKMPPEDLIENHIFDCLIALPHFKKTDFTVLADFGSGGGMPSVILALAFPDKEIRAFEKSPKKRDFLQKQADLIPNLKIYAEVADSKLDGVDLVTARAFKPLDVILKLSRKYHQSGGSYLLYKAKKESVEQEIIDARLKMEPKIIELSSPYREVERCLVEYSKKI